jgi:hypothetical protein
VGVEMSPEGSSQLYPVGAVLSATGLTTIAFKLESPQVAALVLLRLYKPRDSSNMGLAQIRILGSLALPSSDQPASGFRGKNTNSKQRILISKKEFPFVSFKKLIFKKIIKQNF